MVAPRCPEVNGLEPALDSATGRRNQGSLPRCSLVFLTPEGAWATDNSSRKKSRGERI